MTVYNSQEKMCSVYIAKSQEILNMKRYKQSRYRNVASYLTSLRKKVNVLGDCFSLCLRVMYTRKKKY